MAVKLTPRQAELLERVCLKRYTVVFEHYMGSFRPHEGVRVDDLENDGRSDHGFRPQTAAALHSKGLVRYHSQGLGTGWSIVKPTATGLAWYRETHNIKGTP